ncbi:MAG TPA: long-chain fatty acid--CoA ligase [Vicinamibacterales bacterium]|nr:long-chain fatty acid--CoA ligase [Vicinamibacterales bacterium]
MEKRPWLKHYDYWVRPHMSYPGKPLYEILATAAVDFPDNVATAFMGAELTYADLKRRVDRFASYLAELGIAKGDRVGIMLPNSPQYIIAAFGILRLGAIIVNLNPTYTAREVVVVARDSGIRVLVTLDAIAPLALGIRSEMGIEQIIVTSLAEHSSAAAAPPRIDGTIAFADCMAEDRARPPHVKIDGDDVAVLQYTGGTTGTPKGAMLTHANIFANVVQTDCWTSRDPERGARRYVIVLPYFHIYAFTVGMMTAMWNAGLQVILPKYDPDAVINAIRDHRPTYFPAVPTIFVSLLNHPRFDEAGFDQVRHFNTGGAPCPVEVIEEFERRTGRSLNEGYGLSETSPTTHSTPHLARRKPGTIGLPFPDTDVKIVDVETGTREMPVGEAGELCVSGPQVMKGYWQKPDESAHVLRRDADGRVWFHTGDIATMDDDGFTRIVQRKKDLIIVDGFNVYPSDVESVLYTHPAVRLAAVIGVADAYHGEVVRAAVVLKEGASCSADDLLQHCKANLAEYKIPRQIDFRTTMPMSAVGKILYRVLREELQ